MHIFIKPFTPMLHNFQTSQSNVLKFSQLSKLSGRRQWRGGNADSLHADADSNVLLLLSLSRNMLQYTNWNHPPQNLLFQFKGRWKWIIFSTKDNNSLLPFFVFLNWSCLGYLPKRGLRTITSHLYSFDPSRWLAIKRRALYWTGWIWSMPLS